MKVLIFSDLHLNNWRRFGVDREEGMSKRLCEQRDVLNEIIQVCRKEEIDLVINGGDLFHKVGEVPVECLNVANKFFTELKSLGIRYVNVQGNHDVVNRVDPKWFQTSTGVFDVLGIFAGQEKIKLVNWTDVVDYDSIKGYDLVVLHKEPVGAKVGSYTFDTGLDWKRLEQQNKLVFFAHIHEMQKFSDRCYVLGSPMHLTFGDVGPRGCWIVDLDKDALPIFYLLMSPKFVTVDTPEEVKKDGNYYRVLNAKSRIEDENVVGMIVPEVFEERIKSDNFEGIVSEWLKINGKGSDYADAIRYMWKDKGILGGDVFKGKLSGVSIWDFVSVGKINYQVKNGFTLVVGNSDVFDSNGSGKSTAFGEAIYWCLFGETTKGLTGDDVVRRGKKDGGVAIILSEKSKDIIVTRSRRAGLVVEERLDGGLVKELTQGLRQQDRQKVLEDLLGFNKKVFRAACYFSQENLIMITGLSDSEKTDMITDLLGFEVYDDLYNEASKKMKDVQSEIDMIDSVERSKVRIELERVKVKIENTERMIRDIESSSVENYDKVKRCDEIILGLQDKLDVVKQKKQDDRDFDKELSELYDLEKDIDTKLKEVGIGIDSEKDKKAEVVGDKNKIFVENRRDESDIDVIYVEVEKLSALKFGERCDKCGSVITPENVAIFIDDKKKKVKDLLKLVEKRKIISEELDKKIEEITLKIQNLSDMKDNLSSKLSSVRSDIRDGVNERKEAQEVRRRIDIEREGYNKSIEENKRLKGVYEEDGKKLKEKEQTWRKQKQDQLGESSMLEEAMKQVDVKIEENIKVLDILDFWKMSFSYKGIRSLLLDRFCNQFNVIVNRYLSMISNGEMSIVISPTKQLKTGEERNKIGLDIKMDKDVVKYESLSGGEKRRVDVSLCLGLNRWVSEKYSLENGLLGVLILDEIFSFVDRVGEESIGSLLYEEGMRKAVYVISHTPELSAYARDIYMVVKDKDISSLETGFVKGR